MDGFENLNDHDGDHAVNAIVEGPRRFIHHLWGLKKDEHIESCD